MKSGEKSYYKEINKHNDIKFPIKVDVALQAHKVSLIIQAELGSVSLPPGNNFKKHYAQYGIDKTVVFAHANRLIRCIIDCQLHLEDAISARHALELGRSLAAQVWDNTPMQLKQLEGIGDITARKLAAVGINSIEALSNIEAHKIEQHLSKNPPYGHKLLSKVSAFPHLRVGVKAVGREVKPGTGVEFRFRAEICFLNHSVPTTFRRRPIFVCFLAETSDGRLIDFRRTSAKKIQNGSEFLVSTLLMKPVTHINCYVMCDEVAGTSTYAELKVERLASSLSRCQNTPLGDKLPDAKQANLGPGHYVDDFNDENLDDGDLLAMDIEGGKIEEVQDIDDIFSQSKKIIERFSPMGKGAPSRSKSEESSYGKESHGQEWREPKQLDNGKWTCQHDCKEKGKECKHKCCHEGVANPRRNPKRTVRQAQYEGGQQKLSADKTSQPRARPGSQEVKKLDQSQPLASRSTEVVPADIPDAHDEHPTKRRKLSSLQRPYGPVAPVECDDSRDDGPKVNPSVVKDEPFPATQSCSRDRSKSKSHPVSRVQDGDLFDFGLDDLDFDDGDWERLTSKNASGDAQHATGKEVVPSTSTFDQVDLSEEPSTRLTTTAVDLGGFVAPLTRIALSDVQKSVDKGLFITGYSSSPYKCTNREATKKDIDMSLANDLFDDFAGLDDADLLGAELTSDTGSRHAAAGIPSQPLFTEAVTNTSPSEPGKSAREDELRLEKEEELKKRAYEEDQKKKWEGLDPKMYEEYGKYVELI